MPTLRGLMDRGAVGVLSVRSEGESTRCGDGVLEISAGTRVPSGVRSCDIDGATLFRLRARYRHSRYGAKLGLLGDGLGVVGAGYFGPAATMMAASSGLPAGPSFGGPPNPQVTVDTSLYGSADRMKAASRVDALLADRIHFLPGSATVLVAGISDGPRGGPHLHPVVIAGPGWSHHALVSPTTGRAPYVQLFDLTATLLSLSGHPDLPDGMSGRAVHTSSTDVRAVSTYVDLDRHARRALHVGHPTFTGLCVGLLVVLLLLLWRPVAAVWPARLLVFAPLATWLVQLLPWWRSSLLLYAAFIVGFSVVGAAVLWLVARRSPGAALLLGPAVTAGVLLVDQLVGAPLQLSAPLGDNPLVAGRFHGMGNVAFGVTMASALLCLAVIAATRSRRAAVVPVVVGGCIALVIDGAPSLGDDIGGILALVPALAVLLALTAGIRLTARRLIPAAVAAVVVAVGVALADYARPEDKRTHAGRFVEDVRNGHAWQTLHRKLDAVLSSFGNPVVTALVLAAIVVAVVLARRSSASAAYDDGIKAAAVAVAVLAVIGSALNDSGVFVAAAALLAFVPATVTGGLRRPALGDTRTL